ncbi:GAD-like domain-containing protein [Nocardia sp. NPDC051756]|uniref:GAD-like domain-containing protein n=1 Tax=Nocardia sp. NPDC051756 TaxID=3154751 RepID=UPI00343832BB
MAEPLHQRASRALSPHRLSCGNERPVPESCFAEYGGRLPELMLELWRAVEFAGFSDGLLWVCDPHYGQPIVDICSLHHYAAGQRLRLGETHCWVTC